MTCEECQNALDLYALDALDADERRAVDAHLETRCDGCSRHLAEARHRVNALALSLTPVAPPPQVRARLLERAAAQPGAPAAQAFLPAPRTKNRPFAGETRASPWRWLEPLAAAGIAAAVTAVVLWHFFDEQRRSIVALRDDLLRNQAAVQELRASVQEHGSTLQMFASPAVQLVALEGAGPQPGAKGRVFWDKQSDAWHFYAASLKPPAPGKTYELWLINSAQRKIPAGTFSVNARGEGSFVAQAPPDAGQVVAVAVTDEPIGGVQQPTGNIQLLGKPQ